MKNIKALILLLTILYSLYYNSSFKVTSLLYILLSKISLSNELDKEDHVSRL
jgi:hypothetical protein